MMVILLMLLHSFILSCGMGDFYFPRIVCLGSKADLGVKRKYENNDQKVSLRKDL